MFEPLKPFCVMLNKLNKKLWLWIWIWMCSMRDFEWIMEHHEYNCCVFDKRQVFSLTRRAYTDLYHAEGKHYYTVHFGPNKSSVHLMADCRSSTAPPHSSPPPHRVSCCQTGPRDFVPVWIPEEFQLPGVNPQILDQCPGSIQSTLGSIANWESEGQQRMSNCVWGVQ